MPDLVLNVAPRRRARGVYSLVLYTLRLRLATPYTKGESSVACVLCHVLCNRLWALPQRLAVR
jgi:hypothetical protein